MRFIKLTRAAVGIIYQPQPGKPVYIDPRFISMMYSGETIDGASYTKIFLGNMADPIYVLESIDSIMNIMEAVRLSEEAENERKEVR